MRTGRTWALAPICSVGLHARMVEDSGAIVAPLVLPGPVGPLPAHGRAQLEPPRIVDGALAWDAGLITYVGPASGLGHPAPVRLPAGHTICPGFVDCHTHLPFVGWRADEYAVRLSGGDYRQTHGAGGGIARSAALFAAAPDDEVIAFSARLADEMLGHGTTALELKTGYGLSVEGELRQARLARALAEQVAQTCRVTLLAAHAVPADTDRAAWVRIACEQLIPAAAAEGLVDAVDVYVEDIAFTIEHLRAIAEAADAAGLALRVHADQLGPSRAAELAVALGARSADHLNHVGAEGIRALGGGATVAALCPGSTFSLRTAHPPVAELLAAGAALAIATDCNPGTSPLTSMPEAIALACTLYGLAPGAALVASTANPAWVLGAGERLGTLTVGKRADFLVLEGGDEAQVPYRPGHNPVLDVHVGGRRRGGRRPWTDRF